MNLILMTDSYKVSHWKQYPPGTEYVYSYIESRGGIFDKNVFFGLQIFIKKYLTNPITRENIDEAEIFFKAHGLPFYKEGWEHILYQHKGLLPIEIKAVPEGSVVQTHNVLVSIRNTDPKCYWLTSYMETAILRAVWYPTSVATISYMAKQIIKDAINISSDVTEQLPFKLHDFGARGVSSGESAGIGGAAHLVNFMGSDTIEGVWTANKYYNEKMAGFSIPAAEHSTITSWGRDHEVDAYRNMVEQFGGQGTLVAIVADSYDIWNATDNIFGVQIKQQILDAGCTVVVRPDSGDPLNVPIEVIEKLDDKFGSTINSKGYNVLNPSVRVIQGDGITIKSLPNIIDNLLWDKYAIDNLSFGMGGGLLQMVNRDTFKFAMKCSGIVVNGVWRDVFKDPITDPGKSSKKGELALIKDNGIYKTVPHAGNAARDELLIIYYNGDIQQKYNLGEVRSNSEA